MNPGSLFILIIEDNAQLAANLYDYLEAHGHHLDAAPDGLSGLHLATVNTYDAIVLDWNLPRMDGLAVLRKLRESAAVRIPVIMLTSRDALADKIDGFEAGLDDYLVKPIALPELEIRLRKLAQRLKTLPPGEDILTVADLSFNLKTMLCVRGARSIALTPILRRVLEALMRESPNVVHRQQLMHVVWNGDRPDGDVLRSHMHLLRRAIDQPGDAKLLHTVSGTGYRLGAPN